MLIEADPEVLTEAPAVTRRRGFTRGQLIGFVLFAAIVAIPIPLGTFPLFVGQYALVYAMLGLSIVIVTGYAGMISLMTYTFAGIGAVVSALAVSSWGWPFWLAAPLAVLATVPIAILVGTASVRLKGLYLAIATLTFADALGETFFKWKRATGGNAGWSMPKPRLGPINFKGDLAFYLLCLGTVLLLVWMVEGLRTSRLGRAMLAVRDNQLEAQALGINVFKTKLTAFVLSGMVAGLAGSFVALLLSGVTPVGFQTPLVEITSVALVALVVIGGIDRALGAFIGATALVVQQQVFAGAKFFTPFFAAYAALGLILLLLFRPGGLIQVGKIQIEMIRKRPAIGIAVAVVSVGLNVGLAALILHFSH